MRLSFIETEAHMARKSVLWNIWSADRTLNLGRVNAWAGIAPAKVVDMFIAQRQRLSSRPLGLNAADYVAAHYPINALDDYGD
jgi:hypothetical protein